MAQAVAGVPTFGLYRTSGGAAAMGYAANKGGTAPPLFFKARDGFDPILPVFAVALRVS